LEDKEEYDVKNSKKLGSLKKILYRRKLAGLSKILD
jgi:hypothetical protein